MTDWSKATVQDLQKELIQAAKRLAPYYKIEAIRYYRCATNLGLRDCKDQVELWCKEFERDQEVIRREGWKTDYQGRLDDHAKLINSLCTQVAELAKANAERLDENISFEKSIEDVRDQIDLVSGDIDRLDSRIDYVRSDIENVDSKVDRMQDDGM